MAFMSSTLPGAPGADPTPPQEPLPQPSLPLAEWQETHGTLHMWMQIVDVKLTDLLDDVIGPDQQRLRDRQPE